MVLYYNNASKMIILYYMSYAKPGVNWIKNEQDIWGDRTLGLTNVWYYLPSVGIKIEAPAKFSEERLN